MRVAVVDIGTNSTRLLITEVRDGQFTHDLARRSEVTRLGEGVDRTGRLGDEPMARVFRVLDEYREQIDALACDATTGVLTSAVRDAANGAEFTATVRERYGLDVATISGEREAELTFAGATSDRGEGDRTRLVVIDIGGGSTEMIIGADGRMGFHVSTQAGVVRQTERFLAGDPPSREELDRMAAEVREIVEQAVPRRQRRDVEAAIAVAGSATQLGAIDQALEPYDPERVHGHRIGTTRLVELRDWLAGMPLAERREVTGMHPDRAPTIVAGCQILLVVLEAFALDGFEISEHDILRGAALARAQAGAR